MDPSRYQNLPTPCMVIDHQAALRNIRHMQAVADQTGVALRPHIKTHKMPFYARLQVAAGAKGITCAKVSEAEVMADGGIDDIFIAYPLVGAFRMERALALLPKCRRLILAVDSLAGARALNDFALARGAVFEVRMEVDTGARRTGVALGQAVDLALALRAMEGLRLTGVYTFKSMLLHGDCCTDRDAAGAEEGALLRGLQTALGQAGVHLADVSAGSTPTGETVARTGAVTEIRPGTYIFNDHMVCCEGAARPQDIAARYVATVVSTPSPEYAVLDGGTKMFATDVLLHQPPYFYESYAYVDGREDLVLARLNEEHGMLTSTRGPTGLQVGQVVTLVPVHVCTGINLQNSVYIDFGDSIQPMPVAARGMLV